MVLKVRKILFFLSFFFLSLSAVNAQYISIIPSIDITFISPELIEVRVSAANHGDSYACRVFSEIKLGNKSSATNLILSIPPNASHTFVHILKVKELGLKSKGTYPICAIINYQDEKFYPFSMPCAVLFSYYAERSFEQFLNNVWTQLEDIEDSNVIKIKIINTESIELLGSIELLLPEELYAFDKKQSFHLPRLGDSFEISFNVKNKGALPGGEYNVFAIAQFDIEGQHHTEIFPNKIKIKGSLVKKNNLGIILPSILFLFILFIGTIFFEIFKGKPLW
ncbi:MAG: hypothetical protein HQK76_07040 [Desulfobacterales bacterium]|nr:hypothetical protein [Desulfobacterales bacterium]